MTHPNKEEASFSNGQLLLGSNFSYSKQYRHWKCLNIIQILYPSRRTGTAQNLVALASLDSIFQHLMKPGILCLYIPTWTASSESGMSPAASVELSKKPTGADWVRCWYSMPEPPRHILTASCGKSPLRRPSEKNT